MLVTPQVRTNRFAQLQPGDLFVFRRRSDRFVGLKVLDPSRDETDQGRTLLLPIGPSLPKHMTHPTLVNDPGGTVVSFGNDYILRLPIDPDDWEDEAPGPAVTALALAEDGMFLRCNFSPHPGAFDACYVDLVNGEISASGEGRGARYTAPRGIMAYATRWALLTSESPPRLILDYPFNSADAGS